MRMPGKSSQVIVWIVIPEVVQQQERIEILCLSESKRALKLYPRAFYRGLGLTDLFDWT
jgi:hypothetical protein